MQRLLSIRVMVLLRSVPKKKEAIGAEGNSWDAPEAVVEIGVCHSSKLQTTL